MTGEIKQTWAKGLISPQDFLNTYRKTQELQQGLAPVKCYLNPCPCTTNSVLVLSFLKLSTALDRKDASLNHLSENMECSWKRHFALLPSETFLPHTRWTVGVRERIHISGEQMLHSVVSEPRAAFISVQSTWNIILPHHGQFTLFLLVKQKQCLIPNILSRGKHILFNRYWKVWSTGCKLCLLKSWYFKHRMKNMNEKQIKIQGLCCFNWLCSLSTNLTKMQCWE